LRRAWILAIVLLASIALAYGKGPVNVDIIGSQADNTKIIFPGSSLDMEIIGSSTNNTQVLAKAPVNNTVCKWRGHEKRRPECKPKFEIPHLGVDAWYGCYWYTHDYMPRWPQI
jgi:hypothetical protein